MTDFDYGDTVLIRNDAPKRYFPGKLASVCSVIRVETEAHARSIGAEVGEIAHIVEFADGNSVELSAKWLTHTKR